MTNEEKNKIIKSLRGIYSKASVERMIATLERDAGIEVSISSGIEDEHHRTTTGISIRTEEIQNEKARDSYFKLRRTLAQAAIEKMLKGEFGRCAECGNRISEERLEAYPMAVECLDCCKANKKPRIPALAHR